MSETTTISPAIYYEILKAIREGGNEIEMSVTVAPDGTQMQTIVIRPAAPVVSSQVGPLQIEVPPEPVPQPGQRYYCPDCAPCTPSRQQVSGWTPRRCKKHAHCSRCGVRLPPRKRYTCLECESWNEYGA